MLRPASQRVFAGLCFNGDRQLQKHIICGNIAGFTEHTEMCTDASRTNCTAKTHTNSIVTHPTHKQKQSDLNIISAACRLAAVAALLLLLRCATTTTIAAATRNHQYAARIPRT